MKCAICKHGETETGHATVTLERDALTLVVKNVPARVCSTCGEEYIDEQTTRKLFSTLDEVSKSGALVDIRNYQVA